MKNLKTFDSFLNENDGFGTQAFLLRKDRGVYNYLFNLEKEKGGQYGFNLIIGKYSQYENTEGSKNSFAVITLNEIAPEIIDDIAINKSDIPQSNRNPIKVSNNEGSRLLEQVEKCLYNYLEQNSKVVRIYDEIQETLTMDNYMETLKSIVVSNIGEDWRAQEGSNKKIVIISR